MARCDDIIDVVASLGPGEVTTYGDVAADAGYPGLARYVGHVLATAEIELPWWRVVNASGRLAPGKEAPQRDLLVGEGVVVRDGAVIDAPLGRFARRR